MSEELITEKVNTASLNIDKKSVEDILRLMNEEDKKVAFVVEKQIQQIAKAVKLIVISLKKGGRLFYIGAGTSGRLGIVDAAECPPTFGTDPLMVQGIIAGGKESVFRAQEGAEDNKKNGAKDLLARGVTSNDTVVGLSTSGTTPYVAGALKMTKKDVGAKTISITCNPQNQYLERYVDVGINLIVGPEVLTGSTRLKAGTSEKMVLNMLTTASMVKLGQVKGNLMVNIRSQCKKLANRGEKIIMATTGVTNRIAKESLKEGRGSVRKAIEIISLKKNKKNHENE